MRKVMRIILGPLFLTLISLASFAQEDAGITDEQLWKYALLQEVIDQMKKDISTEINEMIKAQEGMTGQRYNELASTRGDADKLASIDAQEWEVKFLEQTDKLKNDRIEAIKTVNSELATKMVGDGGKIFKAIREQLDTDADLKSRYEAIRESLVPESLKAD